MPMAIIAEAMAKAKKTQIKVKLRTKANKIQMKVKKSRKKILGVPDFLDSASPLVVALCRVLSGFLFGF